MAEAPHWWNKTQIIFAIAMGLFTLGVQQWQRYSDHKEAERDRVAHQKELQEQKVGEQEKLTVETLARRRAEDLTQRAVKAAEDSAGANKMLTDIARNSLWAQNMSARTAQESLNTVMQNFRFENRPNVTIVDINSSLHSDGRVSITVTFANTGKSEVFLKKAACQLLLDLAPLGEEQADQFLPMQLGIGKFGLPCTAMLTSQQMTDLTNKTSKLRWTGQLIYDDLFGHANMTTGACLEYMPGESNEHSLQICQAGEK